MATCCVVASESLLTYDTVRSGGKQHSSVTLEGIPRSALHLTLPEQAPMRVVMPTQKTFA